jgi:glycosyltransferase involved in cell wall biosynthesis
MALEGASPGGARARASTPPPVVFSVLMAARNHAAYVEEALESVAQQVWDHYELVIVDDGSTDDTAAKIAAWLEKYRRGRLNRAVLRRIPNAGQSAALECGFAECTGAYVCLLDSDDRWLPEKLLEVHRAILDAPSAGIIVHPLHVIGPTGVRTGDVRPKRARLSDGDCREDLRRTARHVAPGTSGVVIRSDIFRQLVPMPTTRFTFGADAYLTFGAMLLTPVRALRIPLGEYRVHAGGQYIGRMLSAEGLVRSLDLQRTIAAHFGLEGALVRNSYFMRNRFALAKLDQSRTEQAAAYWRLMRATMTDRSFSRTARGALMAYWSACLFAPKAWFRTLWAAFQSRQTGYHAEV